MNISDIDQYLRQKNRILDIDIRSQIFVLREEVVQDKKEELANALWCYDCIFEIQQLYINAYEHLKKAARSNNNMIDNYDSEKSKEYEYAWNNLDQCDIKISLLEEVFCIPSAKASDYYIDEIFEDIKKLQPLFPYKYFLSREVIIRKQRCSICDKDLSIRHPCGHIPGRLYMGQLCGRKITDADLICESIVSTPFDKYAILKVKGQNFNFKLLDSIVLSLEPYGSWSYKVEKRLLPQYQRIGRNDKCPCGSGMKYKHCIVKNPQVHYEDYYKVQIG